MTNHYVNLHTGNLWKQATHSGIGDEYTRLKDGVIISGPQPQYFRQIKSIGEKAD